mmetsp:Transcript_16734/g.25010  ORF Transcript_16734/g.25010 Transcript_16734/m.25010 type:complete len:204 (+) Transcript_16734:189-800(+)
MKCVHLNLNIRKNQRFFKRKYPVSLVVKMTNCVFINKKYHSKNMPSNNSKQKIPTLNKLFIYFLSLLKMQNDLNVKLLKCIAVSLKKLVILIDGNDFTKALKLISSRKKWRFTHSSASSKCTLMILPTLLLSPMVLNLVLLLLSCHGCFLVLLKISFPLVLVHFNVIGTSSRYAIVVENHFTHKCFVSKKNKQKMSMLSKYVI